MQSRSIGEKKTLFFTHTHPAKQNDSSAAKIGIVTFLLGLTGQAEVIANPLINNN